MYCLLLPPTPLTHTHTHYITLCSHVHVGRPPWYDAQGQIMDAFVIGLSGGSASGKTTVARKVIESLGVPWVTLLSMDSFYKVLTEEQHELAAKNEYNFDHPGKCHQRREVANEQWSGTALLLKQPFYI